MKSPSAQLLGGALLGDVVESLTGCDVIVQRTPPRSIAVAGSSKVRSTYTTCAFSNEKLLGTAEVVWEGAPEHCAMLLNVRMKQYLKERGARPTNESYDASKGVLARRFVLESEAGVLCIQEKLFLKAIGLLPQRS